MEYLPLKEKRDLTMVEPTNFSPSPDFKWLCNQLFVKLDEVRLQPRLLDMRRPKTTRHYEIINNFINLWRKTVGNDIYPVLILAFPYRDRKMYSIKEYSLIKLVCEYLKLPKYSTTEKRLQRWKQRAGKNSRLSMFCVQEIKKRKSEPNNTVNISIDKLNECLNDIAAIRNKKGKGGKKLSEIKSLKFCLESMSYTELQYFFDILLKDRIIGGLEHKFLNCWHPDAKDYLSVVSDLRILSNKLWNPTERLNSKDLSINIGNAFAPQSAKKSTVSYETIAKKLKNKFYIEEKMDGERIQLHFMDYGSDIKFISRGGIDYSYLYGGNINTGTIAKYLKLGRNVKECILDGEMVTFDTTKKCILPFGLVKSGALHSLTVSGIENESYHPLFMVFDIVYLNGSSLASVIISERKKYLSAVLTPCPQYLEILPFASCSDGNSIKLSLEKAISLGSEGIILKYCNSKYSVASRLDDWIKVKPEYLEQFGENMDLVVIGRDPGKKDSLMCGLAVIQDEESYEEILQNEETKLASGYNLYETESISVPVKPIRKFISFCTIANGISEEEFKKIDRLTFGLWKDYKDEPPPSDLVEFGTKLPIEWIDPKNSIVLEIKARSLENTESIENKYKAGCTIYGGYCRMIREDKDWHTCYTYSDLIRTRSSKRPKDYRITIPVINDKKPYSKKYLSTSLNKTFTKISVTENSSNFFEGLQFYIISDYINPHSGFRMSKEELNNLVLNYGGTLVHNPASRGSINRNLRIFSGKFTVECSTLVERGYDIINPQWILDCTHSKMLLMIQPSHCFNVSTTLMNAAKQRVDILGDSFDKIISIKDLEKLLSTVPATSQPVNEVIAQNKKYEFIPLFLFWNRSFYIPTEILFHEAIEVIKTKIKCYGGHIVNEISNSNIIIVSEIKSEKRNEVLAIIREFLSNNASYCGYIKAIPRIVNPNWIDESIKRGCQVLEEDYPVF